VAAREARLANVAAALLTGGRGTRMGADKARMPLAGVAAATRLARMLARLFEDVLLVGGEPPEDAPGRRAPDPEGPACALRGIAGALAAARAPRVLVLATDLPFVGEALLLALVARPEAAAVAPRAGAGRHALCALFARERALAVARRRLAAGELSLQGLFAELDAAWLEGEELARLDPEGLALTNLNTPEERAQAERRLADAQRGASTREPAPSRPIR
jgi:molybdopterin-guanine dinucleotide biosynthesis protein A